MARIHLQLGQPLLAVRARAWTGALVACCTILVAGFGLLFAHEARPDRFDQAVDSPIIALFANHQDLAFRLAFPGTVVPAVLVSGVIVLICLVTGRPNGAVLAAAAVPAADGLAEVFLKPLVDRTALVLDLPVVSRWLSSAESFMPRSLARGGNGKAAERIREP